MDDEFERWVVIIRIILDMIKQAPWYDPVTYNELEQDVQTLIDRRNEMVE